MKILSIDVGIKNLSFCLLNTNNLPNNIKQNQILLWDNIDLCQQQSVNKCNHLDHNELCNKPAKWQISNKNYYFCHKHSKLYPYLIPSQATDLRIPFLNKQSFQNLKTIATKYKIDFEPTITKPLLLLLLKNYSNLYCYEPIKNTNATKIDLITIGKNIQFKLNHILKDHLSDIHTIIIENQIGPIANKMKTIQGMIAQYFIMTIPTIHIEFISAINKLKDYSEYISQLQLTNKIDYKQRKLLSIQICNNLLKNDITFNEWIPYFSNYKKKDDLSDCLLQGLWYIQNKHKFH